MTPPEAPPLISGPFPPGASGAMNAHAPLAWAVSCSIPALLGCPALHATHGWTPASGLGLPSGHGSRRLCPQRTRKAVCAGATWWDRPPALGLGCRAPGTQEDSPPGMRGENLARHQLM